MVGVTYMPGIDDFGPDETFTTADAAPSLRGPSSRESASCRSGRSSATTAAARHAGCGRLLGRRAAAVVFSHTFEPFTRIGIG